MAGYGGPALPAREDPFAFRVTMPPAASTDHAPQPPVVPPSEGLLPARWEQAVARRMTAIACSRPRSWDLWADVVSPAYDEVRDQVGDAIAVTAAFVEYLSGEALTPQQRKLVAVGIRQYGKAFAFGLAQAVGTTERWDVADWFRYARGVARRVNADRSGG